MNRRRWLLALALVAGAAAASGGSCGGADGSPPAPAATSADPRVASSAATLSATVLPDQPGCAAAVGVDGTVAWAGARGLADLATGAKLSTDTVFDFASVSKQFTAVAVLLLAGEGRLSTADPVARHVPGLPAWAGRVTLDQLIHHTSGIPDYNQLMRDGGVALTHRAGQADTLAALAKVSRLEFPPGSAYRYSNSNYVLLAEAVRAAAGMPLPRFLAERVFAPLDLDLTMEPTGEVRGKPRSYRQDGGGRQPVRWRWEQYGDGAVHGTVGDLVRWADNYRAATVGGRALLDALLAGGRAIDTIPDSRYAGGIVVRRDGSLWHNGAWEGFVSSFEVSADRHTAVAVACNSAEYQPMTLSAKLLDTWS